VNPTEPIETLARIQEASFVRAASATQGSFPPERRMSGPMLTAFLSRKEYGVLATVRPDGRPHAAPVRYSLVGTRFAIGSLSDAQRVRNLRHEPHATLVISEEEGEKHAVVIAEGTTRLLEPLEASLEMRAPFRDEAGALLDWVGVIISLTPERVLSYAAQGYRSE
jgi:nitroimidazol reductase NimA-like FMN-containing flavoprotein (pyridoxamine 5'-phosphate oxidase superfamily)